MSREHPKILLTGDMGESLPPPFGGIIKRCLMQAKVWKSKGATVFFHVYYKHENEQDMGAGAEYFYDFSKRPGRFDKIIFIVKRFFTSPILFGRVFFLELFLYRELDISLFLYGAARAVLLAQQIQKIQPDIVVTDTGGAQSLAALFVGKMYDIPVMLENYAEFIFKTDKDGNNCAERYHRLWSYLVNEAGRVISTSEHCATGPRRYAQDSQKIKIVYSGINFPLFNRYSAADKAELRKNFKLPTNKFIVLSVGALHLRKGHEQLAEAVLRLDQDVRKNIFIVLCGMGSAESMSEKMKEIGFTDSEFTILQNVKEEELAKVYSAADAFCFPSITPRECMGLALKESMSAGLPIVAYLSGGVGEAVQDGINGFTAKPNDIKGLADGIKKIYALSEDERREMSLRNTQKARQLFDNDGTANQTYEEIKKLIGNI